MGIFEFLEQWRDLLILEARYSAADRSNEETVVRMPLDILHKIIHIRLYILNSSVHCGDSIAFTCRTDTNAPFCAKAVARHAGSSAMMLSFQIAAKYKHFAH